MEKQKILTGNKVNGRKKIRMAVQSTAIMLVACAVLMVMVYPLIYTVLNSLKSFEDFSSHPQYSFPKALYFENYTRVFENNFVRYFGNGDCGFGCCIYGCACSDGGFCNFKAAVPRTEKDGSFFPARTDDTISGSTASAFPDVLKDGNTEYVFLSGASAGGVRTAIFNPAVSCILFPV